MQSRKSDHHVLKRYPEKEFAILRQRYIPIALALAGALFFVFFFVDRRKGAADFSGGRGSVIIEDESTMIPRALSEVDAHVDRRTSAIDQGWHFRVTDGLNTLENARFDRIGSSRIRDRATPAMAWTDANGYCFIPNDVAPIGTQLTCYLDGYIAISIQLTAKFGSRDIVLISGKSLTVTVEDRHGNPIEGAHLLMSGAALEQQHSQEVVRGLDLIPASDRPTSIRAATSDRNGLCAFEGLQEGTYFISAPQWLLLPTGRKPIEVSILEDSTLRVIADPIYAYALGIDSPSVLTASIRSDARTPRQPDAARHTRILNAHLRSASSSRIAIATVGVPGANGGKGVQISILLKDGSIQSFNRHLVRLDRLGLPEEFEFHTVNGGAELAASIRFRALDLNGEELQGIPSIRLHMVPDRETAVGKAFFDIGIVAPINVVKELPIGRYEILSSKGTFVPGSIPKEITVGPGDQLEYGLQLDQELITCDFRFVFEGKDFQPLYYSIRLKDVTGGQSSWRALNDAPVTSMEFLSEGKKQVFVNVPGFDPQEFTIDLVSPTPAFDAESNVFEIPIELLLVNS